MYSSSESDSDSYISDDFGSESTPLDVPTQQTGSTKKWDAFQVVPPTVDQGSMAAQVWARRFEKFMLILAYILTFCIIFAAGVVGKGVTFFMIAQITTKDYTLPYCNNDTLMPDTSKDYEVQRIRTTGTEENPGLAPDIELEQIAWVWNLIFAFCIPEMMAFLRSLRVVMFKHWFKPRFREFAFVCLMETLHCIGMAVLIFLALPQLDTTHGLALTNCLCIFPGILLALSRKKGDNGLWFKVPMDIIAILCQISGALLWPMLHLTGYYGYTPEESERIMPYPWAIPVGLFLASCGWWECFVAEKSPVPPVRWMYKVRERMIEKTRYFTYIFLSLWKMIVFIVCSFVLVWWNGLISEPKNFFSLFRESYDPHNFHVREVTDNVFSDIVPNEDALEEIQEADLQTEPKVQMHVLFIQAGCVYGAYIFSKFACKVQIQGFSYAVPLTALVPACITFILAGCGSKANDVCAFHEVIPDYLFFACPSVGDYWEYLKEDMMWLWGLWLISQMWITLHIWFPKSTRLASTEQIFGSPMYNSIFIDQSLALNRRRDGEYEMNFEDLRNDLQDMRKQDFYDKLGDDYEIFPGADGETFNKDSVRPSDKITKVYGCATMWHENRDEMLEMLKSIFRIDMDYSARRLAQKYLQVVDPDYYEWETHIFFDDAFELYIGEHGEEEQIVNGFVKLLVRSMDEAGSFVHCRNIKVKPPKRYPTPYGGKLVWTLPGKTKIVCHLKDKAKIRHKKRWSQCMYMYYLLGFKLMELPISDERKEVMAENTYLLALDGDIDFQPEAITRLVDLMKKNKNLGAACGRIHPIGSGFMQWYQRFEYAIGHWLQKATEHVMGCVLCSPGCFSLMRAKALMDDNVMKMYTTKSERPRDFVQYDQGEDRWLCTLILQRGWRVEYSAASDAFTACPEGFNEFFNQRRRWMPSTIANIFDVLSDYKHVTKVNEDISIFYIIYQSMLMVGTVIGPGTIFLMLVGAFSIAFQISNRAAFLWNLIPILAFMIVCFTCSSKIQLFMAQIMSAVYALVMMAVFVGIMLQIGEDGLLAPTTLAIFLIGGSFILAAILHPQEFWCLPYGIIYYITIPSMYMLLVIYSFFNLNVVSWGTREVEKKKTKAELEQERKEEEELKKAAKKKKKDGGLLSFLYQQSGKKEKAGMEFSLANLFKCMCFTYEDENDPKKQLIKIAASMDDVTTRLAKIEGAVGAGGGGTSSLSFRRRSSYGRRLTRLGSGIGAGIPTPLNEHVDDLNTVEGDGNSSLHLPHENPDSNHSGSESEGNEDKVERDDLVEPFWIEDRDLRNGTMDFLTGTELQFWKDLIEKYLEPLLENKEKQKRQAAELITLRNQMVFSFFMLNAIFITVVLLMQANKENIYITWPYGAEANVTYNGNEKNPVIFVDYTYLRLEPIGLIFVVFFAVVLVVQIIGMLFHRWATVSQIISTTKLPMCEKKPKDTTAKGDLNKQAIAIAQELQRGTKDEDEEKKYAKGAVGRRNTVHNLMRAQTTKKKEQPADLERRFRNRLQSIRFDDPNQMDNAAFRRLSTRRGTLSELQLRRDTFFEGEKRRRSTVQFNTERRMSQLDPGVANGSVGSDFTDDYPGSAYGSYGSQHLETVEDDNSSDDGIKTTGF